MVRKKIEIVTIEINGEFVEAKECRECFNIEKLTNYYTQKKGLGGRTSTCKDCVLRKRADYREENREIVNERNRVYRSENKDSISEYKREYRKMNKAGERASEQRRRARKILLPDTLTGEQHRHLISRGCALTGDIGETHLDHFIPLAWGYGGSTIKNMIPLKGSLNLSKQDANPFEWIKREDIRQQIDMNRWHETIVYLADLNDMTPKEFEEYVYWCEENKRDLAKGA